MSFCGKADARQRQAARDAHPLSRGGAPHMTCEQDLVAMSVSRAVSFQQAARRATVGLQPGVLSLQISECSESDRVINAICMLNWESVTWSELLDVARIYYYFSIQFRENLQIACELYPGDEKLRQLEESECNTDNLSPWPDVADAGEKIDHDEFMRRLLALSPVDDVRRDRLDRMGQAYLQSIRAMEPEARARSIASYEDGGLERVFRAILRSRHWDGPSLRAFRHFLVEHIRFDSDPEQGHGSLSRHLTPYDGDVVPLWLEFQRMLVETAPTLLS